MTNQQYFCACAHPYRGTSISFLGILYYIRSLFSFRLSLYFFSSQYFLVFLSVCSAHQGSCHLKGLGLRKFRLQTRQEKRRRRKWEGEGSQTCAPLHLIVSAEALSASLCPSASSYFLCFISHSVSLASPFISSLPPFLVSLALYLSLPVSCCVSVTAEDARLLLSALKMTPLMLAGTLTAVAGSETLCFCMRLQAVRGI